MRAGTLIVFEGSEGAGKTTQISLLANRFRADSVDVLTLREPGGTKLGDSIRALLLDPAQGISPAAEALLFMASRAEIVARQVDPAMKRGVVVLMDRFFLSTYAYQIYGRALPEAQIRAANALATAGIVPDLTMVLEIPAQEGLGRAAARGAHDRMEQSGDDFHDRVERAFAVFADRDWQLGHPECGPIASVDGRGEAAAVHARVVETLARNLPDRFPMLSTEKAR